MPTPEVSATCWKVEINWKNKKYPSRKDIEVTAKQITNKLLSLRTYYSAERRKEEAAARKSGSKRDDLYQCKWQFYRHLAFLEDTFTPWTTKTNLKISNQEPSKNHNNTTGLVPGKKSPQDSSHAVNRVAGSIESIVGQLTTRESSASTLQHPKSKDGIFGEMGIKIIAKILDPEVKYFLKLQI